MDFLARAFVVSFYLAKRSILRIDYAEPNKTGNASFQRSCGGIMGGHNNNDD